MVSQQCFVRSIVVDCEGYFDGGLYHLHFHRATFSGSPSLVSLRLMLFFLL